MNPQNHPIQLWSVSVNGAAEEASHLLGESAKRNEAAMVDLGHGEIYWGWHPMLGYFKVSRRHPEAPDHLPAYLARLSEAEHVHAGGTSAEDAVAGLLELVAEVTARLEEEARG